MSARFVLASASPARLETLRRAGVEPEVIVSGVDESGVTAPDTAALVDELAWRKASAVAGQVDGALVLGCDSLLELDGRSLGKPTGLDDARERWRAMRGRIGVLHTGHALLAPNGRSLRATAATTVSFANASDDEIDLYCATGEPLAVAGAFTIDGLGGWFVEAIDGDHHNVVGLSLPLLRTMLTRARLHAARPGLPRDALACAALHHPRREAAVPLGAPGDDVGPERARAARSLELVRDLVDAVGPHRGVQPRGVAHIVVGDLGHVITVRPVCVAGVTAKGVSGVSPQLTRAVTGLR